MSPRDRLVSTVVALICASILVLFTDIELKLARWVGCEPLKLRHQGAAALCR